MSWAYLRWYAHALQPLSYAANADGAYAAGCLRLPDSIVSWHSPLQYIPCSLSKVSCLYSPSLLLSHCEFKRPTPPNKKKYGGASLGTLSGSSSGAHSFLHHSFIFALLHTDFRLSLFCISQLLPFFSLGLYVLACPQEHLLSYFDSYTLSLYLNSLDAIFMFHSPYPIFSAFFSHHYEFLWLYIRSLVTTYLPHSHRLLFPMLPSTHCFTYLWILPSRRAFCCRHFVPLLE